MTHDVCDYCGREFGYQPGAAAICMSCGLENVRPEVAAAKPAARETVPRETGMTAPSRERAVKSLPRVRGQKS